LPAKCEQFATAIDQFDAQHKVTHPAHAGTGRTTQAACYHAATRGAAGQVWREGKTGWLKSQGLAVFGQLRFQLSQRRARAHGDDQLAGLVADDAAQGTHIQHLALQRLAVKILGAAPTDAQQRVLGRSGANVLDNLVKCGVHAQRLVWRCVMLFAKMPSTYRSERFQNVGQNQWRQTMAS
jgi:hypothetical protein